MNDFRHWFFFPSQSIDPVASPSASSLPGMIVWTFIILSLASFVAALKMPALIVKGEEPVSGLQTLLLGWMGILAWQFPWLANPAYLTALALAACHRFGAAQVSATIALGFGFLSKFCTVWYPTESRSAPILRLGPAFYFWMSSFLLLFAGVTAARLAATGG